MRKFSLSPALLSLVLALASSRPVTAAEFEAGQSIRSSSAYEGDAYIAAGTLDATGSFGGDAFLAAGEGEVSASTQGDLTMVGGELEIEGPVGDDLRAAAGRLEVTSFVAGDLIAAGGMVVLHEDSVIEGDCILTGGTLVIDGTIKGKLFASGGVIRFGGIAQGPATLRAESVVLNGRLLGPSEVGAQTIRVEESASVAGPFRYWSVDKLNLERVLTEGAISRYDSSLRPSALDKAVPTDSKPWKALSRALIFAATMASLVTILILSLVGHREWIKTARFNAEGILPRMGRGLIYLLLVPLLLVLGLFTVVGAPLATALLLGWSSTVILSGAITATFCAYWIRHLRDESWGRGTCTLLALLLYMGLFGLRMVPFLGWFLELLLAATVFGAAILRILPGKEHSGAPEPA